MLSPPPHTHTPLGCIFIVCAAFCLNEQSSHTRRLDEPDSLRLYTLCISMAAAQNLKLASPLGFLHVGVENGGLLKGSGKAFDGIICTCFSGQQLKQATTAATLHVKKAIVAKFAVGECVSSDNLLCCAAATALTVSSLIYCAVWIPATGTLTSQHYAVPVSLSLSIVHTHSLQTSTVVL